METIIKYLQIHFTKGIGNKTLKILLDNFDSIENIYNLSFEQLSKIVGKNTANLILIESNNYRKLAENQIRKAEKLKIDILLYENIDYPKNLKNIPDPPLFLFKKGSLSNEETFVSVVGTRNPTTYGKKVAEVVVKELVKRNLTVVSGGAYGIDTISHKVAINNSGKTIAVLGTGIDFIYPLSNKKLFEKIVENGALISEFPLGTNVSKYNFPKRNRIVAAISEATIVIEAPEKSGSLITAKLANEYGKPVFAVPHNIDNSKGKGCNLLIKDGAIPVLDEYTIFEEIPYLNNSNIIDIDNNDLTKEEKGILDLFNNEIFIDEIIKKSNLPLDILNLILFELEMKGIIKNENGLVKKLTL